MSTTTTGQRELVHLLAAIRDATEALAGQPDTPAAAPWLEHRAACYRAIATRHPNDSAYPYELALGAADLDEARAARIRRNRSERG